MYRIIRRYEIVKDMYTLHGYVGNPKYRNDRYIQTSPWTGLPTIQTRLAYNAGNVVCFETVDQAYDFITKYMNNTNKVKYHINWKVVKYNPKTSKQITFRELYNSTYGSYYVINDYR